MIRSFWSADWHVSPEFFAQVKPAVDFFVARVEEEKPDFVGIPGDLFVKRGHLNPLEMLYVRSVVERIGRVCPVIVMPGNHDEVHSANAVDSLSGVFCVDSTDYFHQTGGGSPGQPFHNVYVVTKPEVIKIHARNASTQILVCPYPSRQLWMPGKELGATESHEILGNMVGDMVRNLSETLDPDLPSVFMFHGSIENGLAGPEVAMTSEMETVIRQGDLPPEATVCVGGHLHLPQRVGRFLYTGAPCSHTFSNERLEPSFLEVCLFQDTTPSGSVSYLDTPEGWENPNAGYDVQSNWMAVYKRHPIPVAIPLYTIDLRSENLGEDPMQATLAQIGERKEEIKGAKVRLRISLPVAQKDLIRTDMLSGAMEAMEAHSSRVLVETRPDRLVRSENIHSGVTFQEGLKLFLQTQPDYASYEESMLQTATEVDSELSPDQRQLLEPIDVKTLRVGWSNWKQYGPDNVVDFSSLTGVTAVVGANMSGKSNFAETIAFARWGVLRASLSGKGGRSKIQHAIRAGQKKATVWEEFEANGKVYRIDRSITRTASGAKGTLTLGSLRVELSRTESDSDWVPISGETSGATQKKLIALVGTLDVYLATSFSSQFDLTRILDMGPADFETTLAEACNTQVWDLRDGAAKKLGDKASGELSLTRVRHETAEAASRGQDGMKAALVDLRQQAETHTASVTAATEARDKAVGDLASIQQEKDQLPAKLEEVSQAEAQWVRLAASVERLAEKRALQVTKVATTEAKVAAGLSAVEEIPAVSAMVGKLERLESEQKALIVLRERRVELVRESNEASQQSHALMVKRERRLGVWQADHFKLAQAADQAEAESERAIQVWNTFIDQATRNLAVVRERAGLLGEVGDCIPDEAHKAYDMEMGHGFGPGDEPGSHKMEPTLNRGCPLLQDAIASQDSIEALTANLETLKNTKPEPVVAAGVACRAANKARSEHEQIKPPTEPGRAEIALTGTCEEKKVAAAALGYDESESGKLLAEIGRLLELKPRETLAALVEAEKTMSERRKDAEAARLELGSIQSELDEEQKRTEDAKLKACSLSERVVQRDSGIEARLKAATELVTWHTRCQAAAQTSLTEVTTKIGVTDANLEKAKKAHEDALVLGLEVSALERRGTVLNIIRQACSRSGIPFLIVENALPLFESTANRYLEGTELSVQITSQGDEGIERGFSDDAGWHPLTEASGFVKAILGLSMRWALCHVAASFTGTKIRQFTQDEGFGAFDPPNLLVAQTMLRQMVNSGVENLLVISHVPAVVEAADHVLTVTKTPDGSEISGPGVVKGGA
jgi:DNA repair exonuclease SbcCD ATPase subunit